MSVPPPLPPSGDPTGSTAEDRALAAVGYIAAVFVSFLVPLVLYFVKKDQSKFVAFHAMQAILFHVAIAIGYAIAGVLTILLIGILLFPVVGLLSLIFSILAALAAYRGEWYEIPLVGRLARQIVGA